MTSQMYGAAPARQAGPAIRGVSPTSLAIAAVIFAAVLLAVLPGLVNYLSVKHMSPPVAPGHVLPTVGATSPRSALWHDVREAAALVLFLVCCAVWFIRGHFDRTVSGALILLLALGLPFVITPARPANTTIIWIVLSTAVILAVWHIGAPVDGLKWVAISGSAIGAYTIIAALIVPEYTTFRAVSTKSFIGSGNLQLAGPFGHSNTLGLYCVLALALVPFVANFRWRVIHAIVLCATILASASRTSLIAAGILALWWVICWGRSVISIRLTGTALIGCCAAAVVVLPFLDWDPDALSQRGFIWAEGLRAWQESRLVGLGVSFFETDATSSGSTWQWAYVGAGHNLVIDTLVKSGLVGICLIALVLLYALYSVRELTVTSQQIACFGYLITFLVLSTTETIWTQFPYVELFPVVGLVIAVMIARRPNAGPESTEQQGSFLRNRFG